MTFVQKISACPAPFFVIHPFIYLNLLGFRAIEDALLFRKITEWMLSKITIQMTFFEQKGPLTAINFQSDEDPIGFCRFFT